MKRSAWWLLMVSAVPVLAIAHGGIDAAKRSVEASMLVTGEIAVNPDGSVYGYSLDHRDKLPPDVVNLIGETLTDWKFTPVKVDGKPELAKAFMSLRVVAYQDKPTHFVAAVEGAEFGNDAALYMDSCPPDECLTYATKQPPAYPLDLARDGVSGTVYVELKVNRQGRVADLAVRQVDLRMLGDETELARWRASLAQATVAAARKWTFHIPLKGKAAQQSQWFVTAPVNYVMAVAQTAGYGSWDAYVPGPIYPMPWSQSDVRQNATGGSGDAVPDSGTPFIADARFQLLTPLAKSGAAKPPVGNPGPG